MPAPSVLCLHSQAPLSMLESMQNLKITYFMNREIEAPKSLVLRPRSFCSISLNLHQSQGREPTFIVCHIRDRHFLALSKLILVKSAGCTWSSPFVLWVENQRHRAVMWFAWCTRLVRPGWLGQSYSQPVLSVTPPEAPHGMHRESPPQRWWGASRACCPDLVVFDAAAGHLCFHWLSVFHFLAVSTFSSWPLSLWATFSMAQSQCVWGGSSGLLVTNQIGIAVMMGLDK